MTIGTRVHTHDNHQVFKGPRSRGGTKVQIHGGEAAASGATHVLIHSEKENDQDYALVEQVGQCTVKHHRPKVVEPDGEDLFDPTPDDQND